MKTYGGVEVLIALFLTSALVRAEWSASRPSRFTPAERAPGIHWRAGWVSPSTDLDDVERRKSCLYRYSNSDPSAVQPVASRYTDWGIPTSSMLLQLSEWLPKSLTGDIGWHSSDYTALYLRRLYSSQPLLWEPQNLRNVCKVLPLYCWLGLLMMANNGRNM
jgi:hypothetical protein